MTFSYSGFRTFLSCQTKWFYETKAKSAIAKDPFRKRVNVLSNLQTISAWRGQIVDTTLGEYVITNINKNKDVSLEGAILFAKDLVKRQHAFATGKRYWEDGMKKSGNNNYAALFEVEYGLDVTDKDFRSAWNDIVASLRNFFNNSEFLAYLKSAEYLISQRALQFDVYGKNIKGIPDLIVFHEDKPPHIIDWKVHFFATKHYYEQLLIYALALSECNEHKDFPASFSDFSIYDYRITEYQLLKNEMRDYPVTRKYIDDIYMFLAENSYLLELHGGNKKYTDLDIDDYEKSPKNCLTCSYKKVCCHE